MSVSLVSDVIVARRKVHLDGVVEVAMPSYLELATPRHILHIQVAAYPPGRNLSGSGQD